MHKYTHSHDVSDPEEKLRLHRQSQTKYMRKNIGINPIEGTTDEKNREGKKIKFQNLNGHKI